MRNSKMIKLTHLEGTIQRMWVYLQSCPTVTTLNSGTCPSLLASPTGNLSLFSPTSQPQAITNLLFFFFIRMDLPILDISYKWDHTMCGPL